LDPKARPVSVPDKRALIPGHPRLVDRVALSLEEVIAGIDVEYLIPHFGIG
jgi:hypothetical protein